MRLLYFIFFTQNHNFYIIKNNLTKIIFLYIIMFEIDI
jgi:hypothetical protein